MNKTWLDELEELAASLPPSGSNKPVKIYLKGEKR